MYTSPSLKQLPSCGQPSFYSVQYLPLLDYFQANPRHRISINMSVLEIKILNNITLIAFSHQKNPLIIPWCLPTQCANVPNCLIIFFIYFKQDPQIEFAWNILSLLIWQFPLLLFSYHLFVTETNLSCRASNGLYWLITSCGII